MRNSSITIHDIERLHRKYAPNNAVYNLVYGHCQIVCEIALWCVGNITSTETVDVDLLQSAALLHDIGTYILFNDSGKVINERMYMQHAILGAKIVADEGLDMRIVQLIETHVLLGLTKQEITDKAWPLPARDYEPKTVEGELLCYADRFHSKRPTFNAHDSFLKRLQQNVPQQAGKFAELSERFGVPDVGALAQKWGQPVA